MCGEYDEVLGLCDIDWWYFDGCSMEEVDWYDVGLCVLLIVLDGCSFDSGLCEFGWYVSLVLLLNVGE